MGCEPHLRTLAPGEVDLVQRRPQAFRELLPIIIGPEVHEEKPRLFVEHVRVQGRDLNPIRLQLAQHRIDLFGRQDKIAGNGRLAAPSAGS